MSAEWPVVIYIHSYGHGEARGSKFSTFVSELYWMVSRARVHSTVIVLGYEPGTCKEDDKLIEELRQCRDVCRIVDIDGIDEASESVSCCRICTAF